MEWMEDIKKELAMIDQCFTKWISDWMGKAWQVVLGVKVHRPPLWHTGKGNDEVWTLQYKLVHVLNHNSEGRELTRGDPTKNTSNVDQNANDPSQRELNNIATEEKRKSGIAKRNERMLQPDAQSYSQHQSERNTTTSYRLIYKPYSTTRLK